MFKQRVNLSLIKRLFFIFRDEQGRQDHNKGGQVPALLSKHCGICIWYKSLRGTSFNYS